MAPTDSLAPLASASPAAGAHEHPWLRLLAIARSLKAEVQEQLSRLAILCNVLAMDEAKHHKLAGNLTRFHEHR